MRIQRILGVCFIDPAWALCRRLNLYDKALVTKINQNREERLRKLSSQCRELTMSISDIIILNNGQKLSRVGLGTWQARNETEIAIAVEAALDAGYKHIDTAFNYFNEEIIGDVLKKMMDCGKIKREDIFITTKLPPFGNRQDDVPKYLNSSLKKLQLNYVDLYLVHHPFGFMPNCTEDAPATKDGNFILDVDTDHIAIWKELEKQVDEGKIKGIGLSNFNETQINKILEEARIPPVVLQVELHAHFQQKELRSYCKDKNITVVAFSPLGSPGAKEHFMKKYNYSPSKFPDILGTPIIHALAEKYKKTPAQILLRHLIQSDICIIPKSTNPTRIKQNIQIYDFELNQEEMMELNCLDAGEEGRIFDFLMWKGVQAHPQYPFQKKEEAV